MILNIIYSKLSLFYTKNMKRFILFLILVFPIFSSCKNLSPEYSVHLSVVQSKDMVFYPATYTTSAHLETTQNVLFYCKYFLTPLDANKNIGSVEVYSTDPDVIEILNVDSDKYIITAKTKNKGTAKVRVITEDYYSSTSLYILVQ